MRRAIKSLTWIALGVLVGLVFFTTRNPAHAYPEYTNRTNQQCTTCHVNPAGGGPRTLRGLLWTAEGKPDEVPAIPGSESSGEGAVLDGPTLYNQFECARCHGTVGEGDVAAALTGVDWTEAVLIDIIRNGKDAMKGYPPQVMSDEEMMALIPYVQAIGRGEVEATTVLYQRALPPAQLDCGALSPDPENSPAPQSLRPACGGN